MSNIKDIKDMKNIKNINVLLEDASILESVKKNNDYFISGTFATANKKNRNGRIYNDKIWTDAVEAFNEKLGTQRALVELDHPVGRFDVDPFKAVGKITKLSFDGSLVEGTIKLLNNNSPATNHLKALIDEGITLGVSSRGSGTLDESNNVETYDLSTFDIVADPSDYNAHELVRVNEEIEKEQFVQCTEGCILPLAEAQAKELTKEKEMIKEQNKQLQEAQLSEAQLSEAQLQEQLQEQEQLAEAQLIEHEIAQNETRNDIKNIVDNLNEQELQDIAELVCGYVLKEEKTTATATATATTAATTATTTAVTEVPTISRREADTAVANSVLSVLKSL